MIEFNRGKVLELFVSIKGKDRENRNDILVDEDGILEDKFYKKNRERSILITSNDSYLLAKENNIETKNGTLGENILIDINPYQLTVNDKIIIGNVELIITQNCTICNSLSKIDKKLPSILKCDRGIFAKTLQSGKIRKGDEVKILKY
ncbi:MAG: MOSC domain-containing protein [Campylobacterota bacterium]|nr:MOSC domain-containing protein [Campylobacterota bacterium]